MSKSHVCTKCKCTMGIEEAVCLKPGCGGKKFTPYVPTKIQESATKTQLVDCFESMGLSNSEAKIAAGVYEKVTSSKDIDFAKFSF
jgi:hypothetical protein